MVILILYIQSYENSMISGTTSIIYCYIGSRTIINEKTIGNDAQYQYDITVMGNVNQRPQETNTAATSCDDQENKVRSRNSCYQYDRQEISTAVVDTEQENNFGINGSYSSFEDRRDDVEVDEEKNVSRQTPREVSAEEKRVSDNTCENGNKIGQDDALLTRIKHEDRKTLADIPVTSMSTVQKVHAISRDIVSMHIIW